VQVALPESIAFNSSAGVSGDLLVPGTPTIQQNGHPTYGGTIDNTGSASPSNYTITLNSNAVLRMWCGAPTQLRCRREPAAGSHRHAQRLVELVGQSPGDFTTLKN